MAAASPSSQPSGGTRSPTVRLHPTRTPTLSESSVRGTHDSSASLRLPLCRLAGR